MKSQADSLKGCPGQELKGSPPPSVKVVRPQVSIEMGGWVGNRVSSRPSASLGTGSFRTSAGAGGEGRGSQLGWSSERLSGGPGPIFRRILSGAAALLKASSCDTPFDPDRSHAHFLKADLFPGRCWKVTTDLGHGKQGPAAPDTSFLKPP